MSAAAKSSQDEEQRISALAHFATGISKELNGEFAEATGEFLQASLSDLENEALVMDTARRLVREQKPAEAVSLLEKASEDGNASGGLHALLGYAYFQAGNTNAALAADQLAIKKAPLNLGGYQNLAQVYFQQGRTNDALKVLDQAISQKDAPPEFLLGLAELYTRLQRQLVITDKTARAQILSLADRAASQDLENPLFRQRVADYYLLYGEFEKAEPLYAALYEEYPEAPGVREKLVSIYLRLDKKSEAAELLEEIRREKPTDPQNYYFLGGLAFEGKDFTKAADYFEQAIKLNPNFEPVYFELAGVYLAGQKPQEALEILKRAREKFEKLNFTLEFYTGVVGSPGTELEFAL